MSDSAAELCEVMHGDPCDDVTVDLPAEGESLGDLGDLIAVVYRAPNGVVWVHPFGPEDSPDLPALHWWPGGLIVNHPVDETGIQDVP